MNLGSGRLVLGVDGGGTSTTAWLALADSGEVIGRGEGGPSNPKSVGKESARLALEQARNHAFAQAGLVAHAIGSVCLGLAGMDREADKAEVASWIEPWAVNRSIVNDAELVIAAANPLGWGIALIAGTGSICVGKSADGRFTRSGGWGHLIGDEGSAYGIAIEAMRRVVRVDDGRVQATTGDSLLRSHLNDSLHTMNSEGWVSLLYEGAFDRAFIASLATAVSQAAESGSLTAVEVLNWGAGELALAVTAVYRALGWNSGSGTPVPLGLAGGFILNSSRYRNAVLEQLHAEGMLVRPALISDPAAGAVELARRFQ